MISQIKWEKLSDDNNDLVQNASSTSKTIHLDIMNEIADRQSRTNNIILFNLSEPTNIPAIIADNDQLKLIVIEMEL